MDEAGIFSAALEKRDPEERQEFLRAVCGGDRKLMARIEGLLWAHEHPDSFLVDPAARVIHGEPGFEHTATISHIITEKPGTTIGRYKLREQVGEGGFGVVFMAEQQEPVRRKVALKIIKPGMDTKEVIARFEAERQALALMDHPNIAKVYDAGATESGRPYFVMELVRGVPITEYCDTCNLSNHERLELFVEASQAVQHAHQKGIIHRDIKPSNVLIAIQDGHPRPKVIDFGVAKATNQRLTEQTVVTGFAQMVGTPLYMSPEQAEMTALDVDTRTDVYSLGVLLYELITGTTPFERQRLKEASYDEMRRIIREEEPAKPSHRISTLQQAASTIAEHRRTDPKRLRQSVRGDLDWIAMRALEKDRTRRYETVNAFAADVRRYLNDEPVEACPPSTAYRFKKFARRNKAPLAISAVAVLVLLLVAIGSFIAAVRFERLASDNSQLVTEKSELAESLQAALSDSQMNLTRAREQEQQAKENLALATSEQERAEGNLDLALAALDAVYLDAIGRDKLLGEPVARPDEAAPSSTFEFGEPDFTLQSPPPLTELERELLKRGLDFYDQFADQNAGAPRAVVQTAQAYYRVALLQTGLGESEDAEDSYQSAIERFEQLSKEEPETAEHFRRLAEAYGGLATVVPDWKSAATAYAGAERAYTQAITLQPGNDHLYIDRARIRYSLSDFRHALDDAEAAMRLAPDNVEYRRKGAIYYGHAPSPFRDKQRSLELMERALAVAPDDVEVLVATGQAIERVRPGDGLHLFNKAIDLDPACWRAHIARADLYRRKGDFEQALADVDKAIRMRDEDYYQFILRGNINLWRKEYEEATRDYAAAIRQNPLSAIAYSRRGETYNLLYEYQLAREDFNRAIEINPLMSFEYKDRARSSFCLHDYQAALDDLKTALELHPSDTSTLVWIPPALVAECPDESFRKGFLQLADTAIEKSNDPTRTRHYRIRVYLALNELDKARSDFAALPTPDNTQHLDYYGHALLCLVMGDSAKYRESCQAMLDALAETEDPIAANFVAWTCSLATDAVDDFQRAIALVSAAADARQESGPILYSINGVGANLRRAGLAGSGINARQELDQIVMGAILHRAGRHEEAIQRLTELERRFENPDQPAESSAAYTAYFLAMAYQKTGSEEQARVFLNKANQWTDEVLADKEKPGAWGLRATLEILRKEAEALVSTDDQESADNDQ